MKMFKGLSMKKMFRILSLYLISIFIFAGIPVLFSIYHLNEFFSSKSKLTYIISVLFLSIFSAIFIPYQGNTSEQGLRNVKSHKASLHILQILPCLIIVSSSFSYRFGLFSTCNSTLSGIIGNFLFVTGFSLMNYSAYILGKQFNVNVTIIKDHQLIVNGPYSLIRHPRYLGIILTFTGIPLIFNTYLPLLFSLLILVVLLWRIHDEEILLEKTFAEQWKVYRNNSKKLIPFIW